MKQIYLFFIIFWVSGMNCFGQVAINKDASGPDPSAMLDVKSTSKGLLIPRMSAGQRGSIPAPATGLIVFQTDEPGGFYFYNGSAWLWLGGSNLTGSGSNGQVNFWTGSGSQSGSNSLFWDRTNNRLGIGTNNPQFPLHISGNTNITPLVIQGSSSQTNYNPLLSLQKSDGTRVLDLNSDHYRNVFLGVFSGAANTLSGLYNGLNNTFLGYQTGYNNSSGYSHTFTGSQSGYNNTTGNYNNGYGVQSLYTNMTGSFNTAMGNSALVSATGNSNTAIGYSAGAAVTTGIENVLIGMNSDVTSGAFSNAIAIGKMSRADASDQVRLGNSSISSFYCQGAYGPTTGSSPNMFVNSSGQIMRSTASVPSGTGTSGHIAYWSGPSTLTSNAGLFWDITNARLGIGTSGPGQKLSVEGTFGLLESGAAPAYHSILQAGDQNSDLTLVLPVTAGTTGQLLSTNGSGTLSWVSGESPLVFSNGLGRTANTAKLGGNLTENTTIVQDAAETLTFNNTGTGNTIFNLGSTGNFQIQDAGNTFFTASNGGNIGIGATSPSQKLSVGGTFGILEGGTTPSFYTIFQGGDQAASYTYTLPVDDGTSGQLLSTNGTGILAWTSPSALFAFENGLTVSSNTVRLGGPLTGSTTITQDGAEALTFSNGSTGNTSVNLTSTGDFQIQVNGSPFFTASNLGKIGIGTDAPAEQLEIAGNLRLAPTTSNTGIIYVGASPFIHTYGNNNTFFGKTSGNLTQTGSSNTGLGYYTLFDLTTGTQNTAVGSNTLNNTTQGSYNVAVGSNSLTTNISGNNNVAIGSPALSSNQSGSDNIAIGFDALDNNQTGYNNTAIGSNALRYLTTGSGNIAIGKDASTLLTSETDNIVIGNGSYVAMTNSGSVVLGTGSSTSGTNTIVIGDGTSSDFDNSVKLGNSSTTSMYCQGAYAATTAEMPNLYASINGQIMRSTGTIGTVTGSGTATRIAYWSGSGLSTTLAGSANLFWDAANSRLGIANTSPSQRLDVNGNIAIPDNGSLFLGTERFLHSYGTGNAFLGHGAGNITLTGGYNTGIGSSALTSITTGNSNTGVGFDALYANQSGVKNTAVGEMALMDNTGSGNTAMGFSSLVANSSGGNNTAVGMYALQSNTTGSYNTAVGYSAFSVALDGTYNTSIGYNAGPINISNKINTTALGYNAVPTADNMIKVGNGNVLWIGGIVNWSVLSDGRFKRDVKEDIPGLPFIMQLRPVSYQWDIRGMNRFMHVNSDNKEGTDVDEKGIRDQENIHYSGFISQEVEKAAQNINYDFSGVCTPKNQDDLYSLRYAEFVVPLVKAVQEQQTLILTLQKQNEELLKRIEALENK